MENQVATITKKRVSNYLCDDIVFLILSKLPLKSLKQLACVCKSWSLLFENPDFMRMYRGNFLTKSYPCYDDETTSLLLMQCANESVLHLVSGERFEKTGNVELPPPFRRNHSYINMFNCEGINGVLCLYQGFKKVVLWNPTTGEFKVVPRSPVEILPYDGSVVLFHGFGYDIVGDDYKVIRRVEIVVPLDDGLDMEEEPMVHYELIWEIYSFRYNTWRILDEVEMPPNCYIDGSNIQVYLNGMCHWWSEGKILGVEECLVSFDLSNEVFVTTPMPSYMDDGFDFSFRHMHLVVLKGYIALVSNNANTTTFDVSVLDQVGVKESWTKLFVVGPLTNVEHPIGVGKNSIFFKRKKRHNKVVWIDLSAQKIEEFDVKGESFCFQMVVCKESFLPILGKNK